MKDHDGNQRTKCPLCGGVIEVSFITRNSEIYKITKQGKISKHRIASKSIPQEIYAMCNCGAIWEKNDFELTASGYFIDFKY